MTNDLDEPTSVHWHGMHLPATMDGGPHQMIEPGQTWKPHWTIDQAAATLWYHRHPHGKTEDHVYKGLAGMVILDDDATRSAELPHEYGVDDLPLIVQDKSFDDGQLELSHDGAEPGMLGDTVMVNGTIGGVQEVTSEKVRMRLLNGSTARTYAFEFPDRSMDLIAGDGGLLEEPAEVDRLRLAPGSAPRWSSTSQPVRRCGCARPRSTSAEWRCRRRWADTIPSTFSNSARPRS